MKKTIRIKIVCDTDRNAEYIEKVMRRGTFRALDTSPHYISAPKEVESITVDVINMDGHDDILGNPTY